MSSNVQRLLAFRLQSVGHLPEGNFDLRHLVDIHRVLYDGISEHAGKLRRESGNFAGHEQPDPGRIQKEFNALMNEVRAKDFFRGTANRQQVAEVLADFHARLLRLGVFAEGSEVAAAIFTRSMALNLGLDVRIDKVLLETKEANAMKYAAGRHLAGDKAPLMEYFERGLKPASWLSKQRQVAGDPFRGVSRGAPLFSVDFGADRPNEPLGKAMKWLRGRVEQVLSEKGVTAKQDVQRVFDVIAKRDIYALLRQPEAVPYAVESALSQPSLSV